MRTYIVIGGLALRLLPPGKRVGRGLVANAASVAA